MDFNSRVTGPGAPPSLFLPLIMVYGRLPSDRLYIYKVVVLTHLLTPPDFAQPASPACPYLQSNIHIL